MNNAGFSMNSEWLTALHRTVTSGDVVVPRGQPTLEIPHATVRVDMMLPVLTNAARVLGYRFMAAEALWILSGDDSVEGIARWSKRVAQFSDDGVRFFGAYGPRYVMQRDYMLDKLASDRDTRQATMTFWRPNPPDTKDVPCTVSYDCKIRDGRLNAHVFMRSSDLWLGLPYDVFSMSMISWQLCGYLFAKYDVEVDPGTLFLTAASSHVYDRDRAGVDACLEAGLPLSYRRASEVPAMRARWQNPDSLASWLTGVRDEPEDHPFRWWRR